VLSSIDTHPACLSSSCAYGVGKRKQLKCISAVGDRDGISIGQVVFPQHGTIVGRLMHLDCVYSSNSAPDAHAVGMVPNAHDKLQGQLITV